MTLSDVFVVDVAAAGAAASPVKTEGRARVGPRARARGSILHRVTDAFKVMAADLRSAWWLPASIPTVTQAWAERIPDRMRVPGEHEALYRGWLVYNHTVGLAVPAAVVGLLGVLTPAVWVVRHPARLLLVLVVLIPLIATTVALT